jgi:WD40 repeat protein
VNSNRPHGRGPLLATLFVLIGGLLLLAYIERARVQEYRTAQAVFATTQPESADSDDYRGRLPHHYYPRMAEGLDEGQGTPEKVASGSTTNWTLPGQTKDFFGHVLVAGPPRLEPQDIVSENPPSRKPLPAGMNITPVTHIGPVTRRVSIPMVWPTFHDDPRRTPRTRLISTPNTTSVHVQHAHPQHTGARVYPLQSSSIDSSTQVHHRPDYLRLNTVPSALTGTQQEQPKTLPSTTVQPSPVHQRKHLPHPFREKVLGEFQRQLTRWRIQPDTWKSDNHPTPQHPTSVRGPLFARDDNPNIAGILDGHVETVHTLRFSPDGRMLMSASEDGQVWVWNAGTGEVMRKRSPSSGRMMTHDVDPTGMLLAIHTCTDGMCQGRLRIMENMDRVLLIGEPAPMISTMRFSRSSSRIAVARGRQTIDIVDAVTGEELARCKGHQGGTWSLDFAGDERLASGGMDHHVRLCIPGTKRHGRVLRGHKSPVNVVRFAPDGHLLASGDSNGVLHVWNAHRGRLIRRINAHPDSIRAMAFSPDSKHLAVAAGSHIHVWNTDSWTLRALYAWDFPISALAFTPRGGQLASGDTQGLVTLWKTHYSAGTRILEPVLKPAKIATLALHKQTR